MVGIQVACFSSCAQLPSPNVVWESGPDFPFYGAPIELEEISECGSFPRLPGCLSGMFSVLIRRMPNALYS